MPDLKCQCVIPALPGYFRCEPIRGENWQVIDFDLIPIAAWMVIVDRGVSWLVPICVDTSSYFEDESTIVKAPNDIFYEPDIGMYATDEAVLERLKEIEKRKDEARLRASQRNAV